MRPGMPAGKYKDGNEEQQHGKQQEFLVRSRFHVLVNGFVGSNAAVYIRRRDYFVTDRINIFSGYEFIHFPGQMIDQSTNTPAIYINLTN